MRKEGIRKTKEAKDVDVIKEEESDEGMVMEFHILKRKLKIHKPQESMKKEISQGHTEEGMSRGSS